jgi:hypothetical protein
LIRFDPKVYCTYQISHPNDLQQRHPHFQKKKNVPPTLSLVEPAVLQTQGQRPQETLADKLMYLGLRHADLECQWLILQFDSLVLLQTPGTRTPGKNSHIHGMVLLSSVHQRN